jgi:hypothetical protein
MHHEERNYGAFICQLAHACQHITINYFYFSLNNSLKEAVACLKFSIIYCLAAYLVDLTKQGNVSCRAVAACKSSCTRQHVLLYQEL